MAKVIITIEDTEENRCDISINFEPEIMEDDTEYTGAQTLAVRCFKFLAGTDERGKES